MPLPPYELIDLLTYDPTTGDIRWKDTVSGVRSHRAGRIAGNVRGSGYRRVSFRNKEYAAHRIAWALAYGEWPGLLDHVNGNTTDNRLDNLRLATPSQNSINRRWKKPPGKTSRYRGVGRLPSGSWQARIKINGVNRYLGAYPTELDAAVAYYRAAIPEFGAFLPAPPSEVAAMLAAREAA